MTTRNTGPALRLFYVEGECCADEFDSDLRAFIVAAPDYATARALVDAECRRIWKHGRLGVTPEQVAAVGACVTVRRPIGTASPRLRRPRIVVHVGALAQ